MPLRNYGTYIHVHCSTCGNSHPQISRNVSFTYLTDYRVSLFEEEVVQ